MAYWWVNQGQTAEFEVEGDFLWSPKESRGGANNQHYTNMTLLNPGDIVFSYSKKMIRAIGVVQERARTSPKPDFRLAGSNWSETGWLVTVLFKDIPLPIAPKDFIDQIRPKLPGKYSPLDKNGDGVQAYLFAISDSLGEYLIALSKQDENELVLQLHNFGEILDEEHEREVTQRESVGPLEKEQLVKARRGQGIFRSNVKHFENACRVTGLRNTTHLVASHIKPWRKCTDSEKIDGENGLLLAHHIDHLFDRGFISFSDSGEILISPYLDKDVLKAWGINHSKSVGSFTPKQAVYLEFHRNKVFRSSDKQPRDLLN
jgi:hypothetical protein